MGDSPFAPPDSAPRRDDELTRRCRRDSLVPSLPVVARPPLLFIAILMGRAFVPD
jgi:hypothetical protein